VIEHHSALREINACPARRHSRGIMTCRSPGDRLANEAVLLLAAK
jgi:hypothetical protein